MKGFVNVVMNDNHLYVPSADDLKDKMRTIPRHVQQSPNLCDNRYRKILWSTVSNAAERSNSSNITEYWLWMDRKISS